MTGDPSPRPAGPSAARQLISLATPIVGINLLSVLMLAVDSAMCGRLPNSEVVLSALALSVQVVFLLMVTMLGLTVGTVALVARAYGAKASARVAELLVQSTQLAVLVGGVVGIVGAVLAGPVLSLLGASPEVEAIGVQYLRPLMLGTPFMYVALVYAGVFRAVGNSRIPFGAALLANVLNLGLNYGLVLGNLGLPQLGVTGSAIATIVAQATNAIVLVAMVRRGAIPNVELRLRPRPIDGELARELIRVGWPAAIDMFILSAGLMTALGMLGRIDERAVAAHGLGLRINSLAFLPGMGIGQATGALIGQALGAADRERARHVARAAMTLNFAIMTVIAAGIIAARYPLIHIFDVKPDTPLEAYAVEWMQVLGVTMLPAGIMIALMGVLQGSGSTRTSLRINLLTVAIQILLSAVLGFGLDGGVTGIWLAFPIGSVFRATLLYIVYRRERWAVTGVTIT